MKCDIHKKTELEYQYSCRDYKCPKCSKVIAKALEEEKQLIENLKWMKENCPAAAGLYK